MSLGSLIHSGRTLKSSIPRAILQNYISFARLITWIRNDRSNRAYSRAWRDPIELSSCYIYIHIYLL